MNKYFAGSLPDLQPQAAQHLCLHRTHYAFKSCVPITDFCPNELGVGLTAVSGKSVPGFARLRSMQFRALEVTVLEQRLGTAKTRPSFVSNTNSFVHSGEGHIVLTLSLLLLPVRAISGSPQDCTELLCLTALGSHLRMRLCRGK